jgi:hypothetical protein
MTMNPPIHPVHSTAKCIVMSHRLRLKFMSGNCSLKINFTPNVYVLSVTTPLVNLMHILSAITLSVCVQCYFCGTHVTLVVKICLHTLWQWWINIFQNKNLLLIQCIYNVDENILTEALSWLVIDQVWVSMNLAYFWLNYVPWWIGKNQFSGLFFALDENIQLEFYIWLVSGYFHITFEFYYTGHTLDWIMPLNELQESFFWTFLPTANWMSIFQWNSIHIWFWLG